MSHIAKLLDSLSSLSSRMSKGAAKAALEEIVRGINASVVETEMMLMLSQIRLNNAQADYTEIDLEEVRDPSYKETRSRKIFLEKRIAELAEEEAKAAIRVAAAESRLSHAEGKVTYLTSKISNLTGAVNRLVHQKESMEKDIANIQHQGSSWKPIARGKTSSKATIADGLRAKEEDLGEKPKEEVIETSTRP